MNGPDGPVEIFRDELGVPHVRATSDRDAFFGQGYVHAADRLWQMCYDRARADGRLAAWIGTPSRVTMDVFCRRMGLSRTARADHEALDDETKGILGSYAAGVNAFLDSGAPLPLELELLGVTPEPWEPWHCGAVLKVRHVLMGTFDYKLWRARLQRVFGPRGAVRPGSPDGREELLVVPVGARETWRADPGDVLPDALATAGAHEGSNNWAVHGSRTASGAPLVAGDPHRLIDVPNVYCQSHIAGATFDAIGLSMPGVPGLFHFGHNDRVAWCITHAYGDNQDLYVERFRGDTYEYQGEWLPAERRREVIAVRGGGETEIDVVITHHGPVIFGDPATGTAIALRWTGTDRPNTSFRTILPTLRARTIDELDDAMRDWVDPANNLVMADADGNIGYVHRGRIPVRSRANAWTPVPGWTGEHDWEEDVPYEELPRLRNPAPGVVVTANNRVCGRSYPHFLGLDYAAPNRALRILERLDELAAATVGDMEAIHADRVSLAAPLFVALVAPLDDLDGAEAAARDVLLDWDRSMSPDSVGATVYAALRDRLAAVILEREPLASLLPNPFPEEPYPTPEHTRIRSALPRLLAKDAPEVLADATWTELARAALSRACAALEDSFGPDIRGWRWERAHTTEPRHPLGVVFPEHADVLHPPSVACGGDGECVNAGSAEVGLGVQSSSVARYVFDLGDWDASRWIVPLGSSGDPKSPHYADQAEAWAKVETFPMLYSWGRIAEASGPAELLAPGQAPR